MYVQFTSCAYWVLKGKSYKRCKKDAWVFVFKILHFKSYLTTRSYEKLLGTILHEKKDLDPNKYQYLHTSNKEFDEPTRDYFLNVYTKTNREKRKTAEFWIEYVQPIPVYREYSRSLREGDLHGYFQAFRNWPMCYLL